MKPNIFNYKQFKLFNAFELPTHDIHMFSHLQESKHFVDESNYIYSVIYSVNWLWDAGLGFGDYLHMTKNDIFMQRN